MDTPTEEDLMQPRFLLPDAPDSWFSHLPGLRNLLVMWDEWCPDDGRPTAALEAIRQFLIRPTLTNYGRLQQADEGLLASLTAVHRILHDYPRGHASWLAAATATTLQGFCACILHAYSPTDALEARYWSSMSIAEGDIEMITALAFPDR